MSLGGTDPTAIIQTAIDYDRLPIHPMVKTMARADQVKLPSEKVESQKPNNV
jgi:hypothetical protein